MIVVLDIAGMHCPSCVELVTETLEELAGVRSARVSLEPGRAVIDVAPGDTTTERLTAVVTELGYTASTATTAP